MAQTSSPFSTIYAFGDSLSDAGNISTLTSVSGTTEPVSPPYFQENYGSAVGNVSSTGPTLVQDLLGLQDQHHIGAVTGNVFSNGPTWVQDLSLDLGLGTLKPSLLGGTDFAYGGAETGSTPQNATDPAIQAISLPAQLSEFQGDVSKPSAGALYTLSIGSNDILDILGNPSLSAQQQINDVNAAVTNEISFVKHLVADGATNLLVLNVPDLGKTPDVTSGAVNGSNTPSTALDAEASHLSSAYDTALASDLATVGSATVHVINAYQLIDSAVANPAAFGLTNVTTPVWSGNFTSASSGTLAVTGTAAQDRYLFWDHLHPTESGHLALAAAAEQLIG
jgi:phospholipase/lecithinase/hemolysin